MSINSFLFVIFNFDSPTPPPQPIHSDKMNESIDSDELSDLLNISMDLSQSPLSIVARDLCPIVGLARRDELHLAGRNGGLHGSSRAGGVGGAL